MSPSKEDQPVLRADPARRWVARAETLLPAVVTAQARRVAGISRSWLVRHRAYSYLVLLPTLVAAFYYFLIAAPQYMSEAHFMVLGNATEKPSGSGGGLAQVLSGAASDTNTLAVLDFMQSRDAVSSLHDQLNLEAIYHRPKLDFVARMGSGSTLEQKYKYLFRHGAMIQVEYDFMNFVGVIKVLAFDPQDAQHVADTLLKLGDQLVDRLNKRSLDDALRVARTEVHRAEERVANVGEQITGFRTRQGELDFNKSADTIQNVVAKLESDLAQARADLSAASAYMRPDSAHYVELHNRVRALEAQIDSQKARLTGSDGAIAPEISAYQRLLLERDFANQDYQLASKALEDAYLQAERQQLFLVRTVDAKVAQESEYPRRFVIVLTVLVTLTVAYGIGWLILAGMREHAG